MDEARMIEIRKRFETLETVFRRVDAFLKSNQEDYERAIAKADADYENHQNFARFCREANEPEADLNGVIEARTDLTDAVESCREDLVFMQDQLRKAAR